MKFVLQRNYTLRSTYGRILNFKKGVPMHVPPELYRDAIAVGAVPEDAALVEELDAQTEAVKRDPVMNVELRDKAIKGALLTMKERSLRGYFTAQGLPSLKQLEILVGFEVDKTERDRIWATILHQEPDTGDTQAAA